MKFLFLIFMSAVLSFCQSCAQTTDTDLEIMDRQVYVSEELVLKYYDYFAENFGIFLYDSFNAADLPDEEIIDIVTFNNWNNVSFEIDGYACWDGDLIRKEAQRTFGRELKEPYQKSLTEYIPEYDAFKSIGTGVYTSYAAKLIDLKLEDDNYYEGTFDVYSIDDIAAYEYAEMYGSFDIRNEILKNDSDVLRNFTLQRRTIKFTEHYDENGEFYLLLSEVK